MFAHKLRHMRTAHLFLTFEQYLDITGQCAMADHKTFQRHELRKVLALVIANATRIETTIANSRLKGRRNPFLKRIRWLDIVMPIKQHCWSIRAQVILAKHYRPASSRQDEYRQPNLAHHPGNIFRDLSNSLTICANTRTA